MTVDYKRILHKNPNVSDCVDEQLTVEQTADADLGFKMWGGKDEDGNVTKWLAKDKPARVEELTVTDLTAGLVATDADGVMSTTTSVAGLSGKLTTAQDPTAHKTSHQNNGSDEISIAGLSGVAGTAQMTNTDSLTVGGSGATTNRLYSRSGLQNTFEWGGRVLTVDGPLLKLIHDRYQQKREIALFFGASGPDDVSNGNFRTSTTTPAIYPDDWTPVSGSSLIQVQVAEKSPEGPNTTRTSVTGDTIVGRLLSLSPSGDAVAATQACLSVGQTYWVSGWVRASSSNPAGRGAQVWVGAAVVGEAAADDQWYYFSEIIEAPSATIWLVVPAGTSGSVLAHFAEISAIRVDSSAGLIAGKVDGNMLLKNKNLALPVSFYDGENGNAYLTNSVGAGQSLIGVLHDFSFVHTFSFLTDAATTQLTALSAVEQMCILTQNADIVALPNATTLTVGRRFRIVNAGTEIMVIQNYGTASSVFELLLPGETLTAICKGVSTAAGKWVVDITKLSVHAIARFETDLIETLASTVNPLFRGLTGGGGTALANSDSTGEMVDGYGFYGLGTSVGGYTANLAPGLPNLVFGSGPVLLEFNVGHQTLSDASEEYIHRVGFGDSVNASDHVDGAYFEYDRAASTGGANIWKICTASNSTRTKTETAIAPTLYSVAMQRMGIVVNAAGTRADFYINEALAGTITTNIPTGAARSVSIDFGGTKTVGSTQRYAGVGYCRYRKASTARR